MEGRFFSAFPRHFRFLVDFLAAQELPKSGQDAPKALREETKSLQKWTVGIPGGRSRRPGDCFEESKVDAEATEMRLWLSERIPEDFATVLDYLGQAPTCVSYRKIQ